MCAGQLESERTFAEHLEQIAGLKDDKRALSDKVDETMRSGEESLEKERGEVRRLLDVLAEKESALENLALSNSDNGIALAAVANKKEELERELLELKEGTAGLVENKLRIEEIDNQKLVLEEELRRVKTQHTEAIANLESAALVAIELQDKLNKENENLEFNVKAQRSDLAFALEKVEELKKQLEAKDVEIEEVQKISTKNEESHDQHYQEKAVEIEELMKTVEELSEKVRNAEAVAESREREVQDMKEVVETQEAEVERLGQRLTEV